MGRSRESVEASTRDLRGPPDGDCGLCVLNELFLCLSLLSFFSFPSGPPLGTGWFPVRVRWFQSPRPEVNDLSSELCVL